MVHLPQNGTIGFDTQPYQPPNQPKTRGSPTATSAEQWPIRALRARGPREAGDAANQPTSQPTNPGSACVPQTVGHAKTTHVEETWRLPKPTIKKKSRGVGWHPLQKQNKRQKNRNKKQKNEKKRAKPPPPVSPPLSPLSPPLPLGSIFSSAFSPKPKPRGAGVGSGADGGAADPAEAAGDLRHLGAFLGSPDRTRW